MILIIMQIIYNAYPQKDDWQFVVRSQPTMLSCYNIYDIVLCAMVLWSEDIDSTALYCLLIEERFINTSIYRYLEEPSNIYTIICFPICR